MEPAWESQKPTCIGGTRIFLWAHTVMRYLIDTPSYLYLATGWNVLKGPQAHLSRRTMTRAGVRTNTLWTTQRTQVSNNDASLNMPVPTLHTRQVMYIKFCSAECVARMAGMHGACTPIRLLRHGHRSTTSCLWLADACVFQVPFLTSLLEPPPLHLATQIGNFLMICPYPL